MEKKADNSRQGLVGGMASTVLGFALGVWFLVSICTPAETMFFEDPARHATLWLLVLAMVLRSLAPWGGGAVAGATSSLLVLSAAS